MLYFSYLLFHISPNHSFIPILSLISSSMYAASKMVANSGLSHLAKHPNSAAPNMPQNARGGQICQRDKNIPKMLIFLAEIIVATTCNFLNNFQQIFTHSSYSPKLYSKSLMNNFSGQISYAPFSLFAVQCTLLGPKDIRHINILHIILFPQ